MLPEFYKGRIVKSSVFDKIMSDNDLPDITAKAEDTEINLLHRALVDLDMISWNHDEILSRWDANEPRYDAISIPNLSRETFVADISSWADQTGAGMICVKDITVEVEEPFSGFIHILALKMTMTHLEWSGTMLLATYEVTQVVL